MIIDHIYLPVSDLERSSEFYKKMLEQAWHLTCHTISINCSVLQSIPSLVSG